MAGKCYLFGVMCLLIGAFVTACSSTSATPTSTAVPTPVSKEPHKLLVMEAQVGEPYESATKAMLAGLANFGYVEGENLEVVHHTIGNDQEKGMQILRQELENDYDVIYVAGTVMTIATKEVAYGDSEHDVVFACVTDPVGVGVIDGFESSPKANFTGVSYPVPVKSRFRFIRQLMPDAETIGLVYADMPQSHSYRKWVKDLIQNDPEFADLEVLFRVVPLVTGEEGPQQMAELAREYVQELDPLVDVFISPNDQMGVGPHFANMVYETATKPLVGIGRADVMEGWGATMSLYPSHAGQGRQCAVMIKRLFEGEPIQNIIPETPKENGYAFDLNKAEQFGIQIPVEMIELAGEDVVR